jgi:hypothetical protein
MPISRAFVHEPPEPEPGGGSFAAAGTGSDDGVEWAPAPGEPGDGLRCGPCDGPGGLIGTGSG